MADKKLSDPLITEVTDIRAGDLLYLIRAGVSHKISKENILAMSLEIPLAGAFPVIADITTMIARERAIGIGTTNKIFNIYRRIVDANTLDDFGIVEM